MRTILLTFGLIVLLALPAAASQTTNATVSLTIDQYAHIQFAPNASFDITITGGGSSGSANAGVTAEANFEHNINAVFVKPENANGDPAPGTWLPTHDLGANPHAAGSVSGTVTVGVTNVTLSDGWGTWNVGGSLTLTITAN